MATIVPFLGEPFTPFYIFPREYAFFGLPSVAQEPAIDSLVQTVSGMVDIACGRVDGDGNGSLAFTTYTQRLMNQSPGRNLALIPIKPLVALSDASVSALQSLALSGDYQMNTLGCSVSGNYFYTGVLPAINTLADGRSSAIIGASGRYTYQRRDTYPLSNDPQGIINPLNIMTLFGGPPPWIPIDMVNLDYDPKTGEMWYAAGQYMERYTEIVVQYTAGYDPTNIPPIIKRAVAAGVKNILAKGSGTTGMKSLRMSGGGAINADFDTEVLDRNILNMLQPFVAVRTY